MRPAWSKLAADLGPVCRTEVSAAEANKAVEAADARQGSTFFASPEPIQGMDSSRLWWAQVDGSNGSPGSACLLIARRRLGTFSLTVLAVTDWREGRGLPVDFSATFAEHRLVVHGGFGVSGNFRYAGVESWIKQKDGTWKQGRAAISDGLYSGHMQTVRHGFASNTRYDPHNIPVLQRDPHLLHRTVWLWDGSQYAIKEVPLDTPLRHLDELCGLIKRADWRAVRNQMPHRQGVRAVRVLKPFLPRDVMLDALDRGDGDTSRRFLLRSQGQTWYFTYTRSGGSWRLASFRYDDLP